MWQVYSQRAVHQKSLQKGACAQGTTPLSIRPERRWLSPLRRANSVSGLRCIGFQSLTFTTRNIRTQRDAQTSKGLSTSNDRQCGSGQTLKLTRLPTVVNGARSVPTYGHPSRSTVRNHLHVFPLQCSRFFSANRMGVSGVSVLDASTPWTGIVGIEVSRSSPGDSIGLTSASSGSAVSSSFPPGDSWISFR